MALPLPLSPSPSPPPLSSASSSPSPPRPPAVSPVAAISVDSDSDSEEDDISNFRSASRDSGKSKEAAISIESEESEDDGENRDTDEENEREAKQLSSREIRKRKARCISDSEDEGRENIDKSKDTRGYRGRKDREHSPLEVIDLTGENNDSRGNFDSRRPKTKIRRSIPDNERKKSLDDSDSDNSTISPKPSGSSRSSRSSRSSSPASDSSNDPDRGRRDGSDGCVRRGGRDPAPTCEEFDEDLRRLSYTYFSFWSFTQIGWREFRHFVLNRMSERYSNMIRTRTCNTEKRKAMLNEYLKEPRSGILSAGYLNMRELAREWLKSEQGKQYQRKAALEPLTIPELDPVADLDYIASVRNVVVGSKLYSRLLSKIDREWVVDAGNWSGGWSHILRDRSIGWFLVEIYTQHAVGIQKRDADFTITEWRRKMPSTAYRDSDIVWQIWREIDEDSQRLIGQLVDDGDIGDDAYETIQANIYEQDWEVTLPV